MNSNDAEWKADAMHSGCAGGAGSSLPSQVTMGRSPPVSTASALEEYSRTGDIRLLQHISALMGSPDTSQVCS